MRDLNFASNRGLFAPPRKPGGAKPSFLAIWGAVLGVVLLIFPLAGGSVQGLLCGASKL
jgi:hypothetical protein